MKRYLVKGFAYLFGLVILSIGVDIMIEADIGVGAWDALNVGLKANFGLTIGTWAQLVAVSLIILIAILKRKRPKLTPLITMFIVGNLLDFHFTWLHLSFTNRGLAYLAAFFGLVLMSIGIALYLQANFGIIPIDGFVMVIHEKTGWSLGTAKTAAEFGAFIVAFLLGGPIGIGTIFVTLTIGPFLQFFYKIIAKRVQT